MIPPIGDDPDGDYVRKAMALYGRAWLLGLTVLAEAMGWVYDRTLGRKDRR